MFHKPPKDSLAKIVGGETKYSILERLLSCPENIAGDKITINWGGWHHDIIVST